MFGLRVPSRIRSGTLSASWLNLRMVSVEPLTARGAMIAFTREPSSSRASTSGDDSSMRRPMRVTMRSMICRRWASSRKVISVR
ncbi:hypothetical protein GCM10022275_00280 [Tessaracoccus defluvii]